MSNDDSPAHPGLSAAEVAERIARGEVNRPPRSSFAEYRAIVVRNLVTLFNALVVPAAIALFLLEDYRGAWAVSAMAVINTVIGLAQEIRAKRHLDTLAVLTEPKARVRRGGVDQQIPAGDVVRGDVVLLNAGEAVVADGAVLESRFLEIDEALLTGESDPVPRGVGDQLLSGSVCVAGDGCYSADKVGGAAFAHELSAEARLYRYTPSPLQRILDTLIRILTAIAVALCVSYVGLQWVRDIPRTDLWQMIAATVTSMVPQGLVLMATLALTLGAVRLSRRGAVIQRLSAVEAMASIDVLCMDKTGTLTTNRLRLDRVRPIGIGEDEARKLLQLFAAASVDGASKTVAALRGALGEPAEMPNLIDQVPFKSQNRYSAVRILIDGRERVLALGAFEGLKPLTADVARAEEAWRELLPTGLRLLLFADAEGGAALNGSLEGCSLRPVALVALSDELRPEAGAVLADLADQGIAFKIISGDNPETVKATVASLSMIRGAHLTGTEFESSPDRECAACNSVVFGRVTPRQKLEIVTALQRQKCRVAMIGDGVNDVLPIKRADLGIAMGAGASAARTVADLVLENNDFALLPRALDEGRTILHNLRRASKLFLLKNVFTLLLIIAGLGILGAFPYLPQQVTLLNVLTIGGPAFLIMLGRPPMRTPDRGRFLREVGLFAIAAGLITGIVALLVWLYTSDDVEMRRTILLTMLVLTGLGNVVNIGEGDRRLFTWVALALPVYAAVMYVAPTAHFFALSPLSLGQWAIAIGAAMVALGPCVLVQRATRS